MSGKKKKMGEGDLYALLGVHPQAKDEVILAAKKALLKIYHPDNAKTGDETMAKRITEAVELLLDAKKRYQYDQERIKEAEEPISGYHLIRQIAEGGFGTTYLAEHLVTGEKVCIKHCHRISSEDDQIMIQEAKAIWNLRHFAIPVVRDLIRLEDGSLALIMSFIPGPTLQQVVEKKGALHPENVCWIAQRILNALKYMHYHGVVHGDIKPPNTIIQPETHTLVVVDYGLSLIKPRSDTISQGYTPYFAPPEQERGETLLPESDFYSLGMTMIYALSGNHDLVRKKEVPEDTPDPLCRFIRKLIVRDVLARPNWEKIDLFEEIQIVREKCFGRKESHLKDLFE